MARYQFKARSTLKQAQQEEKNNIFKDKSSIEIFHPAKKVNKPLSRKTQTINLTAQFLNPPRQITRNFSDKTKGDPIIKGTPVTFVFKRDSF